MQVRIGNSSGATFLFSIPNGYTIVYSGFAMVGDRFLSVSDLDNGEIKFKKVTFQDIGSPVSRFRMLIRHIGEGDDS